MIPREPGKPLEVRFVDLTPDQQEHAASRYDPCELPSVDTTDWHQHYTAFGVSVRLPCTFAVLDMLDEQQTFSGPDGSVLLVTRHAGDGHTSTIIGLDIDPDGVEAEAICRVTLLGRTAALFQQISVHNGQRIHYASVDVGVDEGLGVGAAAISWTASSRNDILAAIKTLEFSADPGSGYEAT